MHAALQGNLTSTGAAALGLGPAANTTGTTYVPSADFGWGGYFQALGGVFLLLALLVAGFWALRRFGPRAGLGGATRSGLKLEGQIALGPKKHVAVVRFLNKRLVLGVTDSHINLLTELEDNYDEASREFSKAMDAVQKNGARSS
ncbi:MAG: flagellar biosynthetic protein FliO [Desulfovibrionaceae bacterium]|nr:flagellar biosynthetic protein FliO [Desulfovibrionaceae bacterium]